ncbi:MAG: SGNH/GDSL hydrolase family protein [Clostridia bacterium]|nr:SGNH/GDSL hydrolase family protein [Clostridia bacterium]
MSDITKIDKNFAVQPVEAGAETVFFNCLEEPFKVYGLIFPENGDDVFHRMPYEVAKATNEGVDTLNHHSAGGRVKFRTNSPYIIIRAKEPAIYRAPHFTLCGSAGFDLYKEVDGEALYVNSFMPPYDMKDGYEAKRETGLGEETDITIHFPLYSRVQSLEIGIAVGSTLKPAAEYKYDVPVVYYGSSITQGGCASRPGMAYQNIISREISCDHINLGFSGSAKGEDAIAEYIAGLKMSVFVYDYDHNAPSVEHLQNTHNRMFSIIREKNPELPIVMVSRPKGVLAPDEIKRRDIIKATYEEAKAKGDRNVWFIDGSAMMRFKGGNEGTVDNCHPTDLGFRRMADVIGEKVKEILEK